MKTDVFDLKSRPKATFTTSLLMAKQLSSRDFWKRERFDSCDMDLLICDMLYLRADMFCRCA